jgi:hypothetical protein
MFEAGDADAAGRAHGFGDLSVVVVIGVEDARIETTAGPQLAPFDVLERHVTNPPSRFVVREER